MGGSFGTARTPAAVMRLLLAAFIASLLLAAQAPHAEAAAFNCDASAIRLQLGTAAPIEPITANRGEATCKEDKVQTPATSGPITVGGLIAETTTPSTTEAQARGGVGILSVSADALTGIPIPTLDAVDAVPAVNVPIPLAGQLLGLPTEITVDIRPAVRSLVTGLQTGPLLELAGSVATANARCVGSNAELSGDTDVAALKVLGQTIPTDAIVQQALTLYNGQTIDPAGLDLSQIVLPPGLSFTDPLLGTILQNAVKDVLAAMPPITLPETLLSLAVSPSSQERADGGLTQRGLTISLAVLGQNVLFAIIGEARVSVDSVRCLVQTPAGAVAPIEAVGEEALECSNRRLALIDVLDRGRYVSLYGAADKDLAGKRIKIRSRADGRVVARPRVSKSGLFRARAPLPPQRWRFSNRARYMAVHGRDRSLNLKLHRRMVWTSTRSRHGKVILRGRVSRPHTSPRAVIVVRQRLTCRRQRIVKRLRPGSDGRFTVTLKAPRKGDVGTYRATTMVAHPGGGPDFRTYTLPGLVRFAR